MARPKQNVWDLGGGDSFMVHLNVLNTDTNLAGTRLSTGSVPASKLAKFRVITGCVYTWGGLILDSRVWSGDWGFGDGLNSRFSSLVWRMGFWRRTKFRGLLNFEGW